MMQLRPYQQKCDEALWQWFVDGNAGNPLIVAPVGAGKSLLMAAFVRRVMQASSDARLIVATHSRELVRQDHDKMRAMWPDAPTGIYSAGLGQRDRKAPVLFASIQSVWRKAYALQRCDVLVVDEAHTISRKDQTMWGLFLRQLREINPNMRVVGYTATHWRQDSGSLIEGPGALFSDIAYEIKMLDLMRDGYLAPLVSRRTSVQIDLRGIKMSGLDYAQKPLEAAADLVTQDAVADIVRQGADRRCWLLFCSGSGHSYHVRDELRRHGISADTVTDKTPTVERDRILADLEAGRLRAVTNYSCLTTGVDVPPIDLIAMLRPTKSSGLVVQMGGRGCRLAPGKIDCLYLDYAGVLAEHGPIDLIAPPSKRGGTGEAPHKKCPKCYSRMPASILHCKVCGYEFSINTSPKIVPTASTAAVLSHQIQPEWLDVSRVHYKLHTKVDKPNSLMVTYDCGLARHRAWHCFGHTGYAKNRAVEWWKRVMPCWPVPNTAEEAMALIDKAPKPKSIMVKQEGKFFAVVGERF